VVQEGTASSLTELAQRFVISHPAVSTMLIGYSTLEQLEAAIAAVNRGPLPEEALKRIAP
jgi:aryl-alcohol dehydrogenase-like predicted oxidoreductase